MLQRVTCLMRGHPNRGDAVSVKFSSLKKQSFLHRIVMIREMSPDHVDWHVVQTSAIEDFARSLRRRSTRWQSVGGHNAHRCRQTHLGVHPEQQTGQSRTSKKLDPSVSFS